jgi:8-oxo-dGTP diphosphatase
LGGLLFLEGGCYAKRMRGPLSLLPRQAYGLLHEIARHLLRRPVVGVAVVGLDTEGNVLLIRRADTGGWALPGGTLEWHETLTSTVHREVDEEAGADVTKILRISGVYSRPDRDPRFHAVTVCVVAEVRGPLRGPVNALEIREVRFFPRDQLPPELSMGGSDMLAWALQGGDAQLE